MIHSLPTPPYATRRGIRGRRTRLRSGGRLRDAVDRIHDRDPSPPSGADVLRLRPDDAIGGSLLEGIGDPSADPADGERRGEERLLEAQTMEDERRVDLDVDLQSRRPGLSSSGRNGSRSASTERASVSSDDRARVHTVDSAARASTWARRSRTL